MTTPTRILIVDDETMFRQEIQAFLQDLGYQTAEAANGSSALALFHQQHWDVLLLDLALPDTSGIHILRQIADISPETIVLIITAFASLETAVEALRLGAYDYLLKPIRLDDLEVRLQRIDAYRHMVQENQMLKRMMQDRSQFFEIIGESPAIQQMFEQIRLLQHSQANVLISGESGTGKELVAHAIHKSSIYAEKSFLPINISAIPENLLESQLFGHVRGAFSGAISNHRGIFQAVSGGTVFLDEIGELPLHLQPRLLRAIEEKEIFPLGAEVPIHVDFRLIAATNRNLEQMIKEGTFREDLFYRLNTFHIEVPPLRNRREDIPLLVQHFVSQFSVALKKRIQGVNHEVMLLLMAMPWKGNVRELRNVIERAVILANETWITPELLPNSLLQSPLSSLQLRDVLEQREKEHITSVLHITGTNKEKAAQMLGLSLATLYRRLEKYEML